MIKFVHNVYTPLEIVRNVLQIELILRFVFVLNIILITLVLLVKIVLIYVEIVLTNHLIVPAVKVIDL